MSSIAESGMTPGGCPFHRGASAAGSADCPASAEAAAFDVFDTPYQLDPAEALRWARAQEPVFYSPKMNYWVVSRYDDVKAVFRDNVTFSPSNALEKVTPNSPEADAVLRRYGYGMNRTLVNEDEPQHMERRRALLHSFVPGELARHEPMVRRLTREFVNRFIDRGHADLVNEMLWEVPLTVALHFLGIPEDDMGMLRQYSVAHTVNTWGRPTPGQQVAVAEAVGRFWQFSGQVLDRMRADPSGHGWMQYAIRQQKLLPRTAMAFLERLQRDHGGRLTVHAGDEGRRLDLDALVAGRSPGGRIYACGPERLLATLTALMAGAPDRLRVEHFISAGARRDVRDEAGFEAELQDTRLTVHVAPGQTLLQALRGVGVDVASDCEEGLCGSCEVAVMDGEIDHRDKVLSASERAGQSRMMTCCSRAKGRRLVLAL